MFRQAARRNVSRKEISRGYSIPAPVGGWDAVSALADMKQDRAPVLDNWIPRPGYVEMRKGFSGHATALGSGVVDSLMVYSGVTSALSKMFAAANSKIYDVTAAQAGTDQSLTTTSNRFQSVNFTTSGGKYLWICNGADAPRHYNGTTWASPSLTVSTFTAADIINVHAHKNRLWFVFKDSTVAGYLGTGAIAGTVTNFELGGLFTKGGYLVAMATWTRDGGTGEDDIAVFISSQGQVVLYAGSDPNDAQLWNMIGVFDLGPPIGYRCFTKVGGDLALLNIDGVLPISQALQTDRGAAASVAITANINNAMNQAARNYSANFGWQLLPYPKGTYVLLNVPLQAGVSQHQYVMNTLTGAWCRFTGQNANCWAVFRDNLYFGGNAGVVYRADSGSIDGSAAIDAVGQSAYNYLGSRGRNKQYKMLQPMVTTDSDSRPAVGVSTDFRDNAVLGTPTAAVISSALYDSAIYDTDVYAIEDRNVADWTAVSGIGQSVSVHFRAQTQVSGTTTMQLNGFNMIYEPGGFI